MVVEKSVGMMVLNISVFINMGAEYLIHKNSRLGGRLYISLHTLIMIDLLWMRLCILYCATISDGNIDSGTRMY